VKFVTQSTANSQHETIFISRRKVLEIANLITVSCYSLKRRVMTNSVCGGLSPM
jgi:hypothetical protein